MKKRNIFLYEASGEAGGGAGSDDDPGDPDPNDPQGGTPNQTDLVPRSELAKANAEAAKYRRERNELNKRIEALEGQGKTQLEQAQDKAKKAEDALTTAQKTNRDLRVQILAGKVGVMQEARGDAARLLNWEAVADPDSDEAIEAALQDLVREKPFLLGNMPGGADGGAGGSSGSGAVDMNALIRGASGRS